MRYATLWAGADDSRRNEARHGVAGFAGTYQRLAMDQMTGGGAYPTPRTLRAAAFSGHGGDTFAAQPPV